MNIEKIKKVIDTLTPYVKSKKSQSYPQKNIAQKNKIRRYDIIIKFQNRKKGGIIKNRERRMVRMYRLYGNISGWKLLEVVEDNELELIKTMLEYVKNYMRAEFIIIKREEDMDVPYRSIQSENELIEYIEEYEEREKEKNVRRYKHI